ncbi:MAG TPA: diguanylate cyclase [Acidimicrobiales bacterium]|nr:diguanylate cyclase [Acidimicrobiales bacterium]
MDRRALPGLFGGLAGCAFAVTGAVVASPILEVIAAACALAAAGSTLLLVDQLRRAEHHAALAAVEATTLREAEVVATQPALPLVDPDTGLPDGRFFELALETRVSAARRHLWPVSVVLVEMTPQPQHRLPDALAAFNNLLRGTLREADTICRLGPRTFGLLLEDTNESGGVWAAERLQAAVATDSVGARKLAAGVAAYPTHGLTAADVLGRAKSALARAAAADPGHGVGVVEVATIDALRRD